MNRYGTRTGHARAKEGYCSILTTVDYKLSFLV